jgi:hypothetical protein
MKSHAPSELYSRDAEKGFSRKLNAAIGTSAGVAVEARAGRSVLKKPRSKRHRSRSTTKSTAKVMPTGAGYAPRYPDGRSCRRPENWLSPGPMQTASCD